MYQHFLYTIIHCSLIKQDNFWFNKNIVSWEDTHQQIVLKSYKMVAPHWTVAEFRK